MNHIKRLQSENEASHSAICAAQADIQAFLVLLNGDKFTGIASDGSRKDWISTSDVIARLREIRASLSTGIPFARNADGSYGSLPV